MSKDVESQVHRRKSVFVKAPQLAAPIPLKARVETDFHDFAEDTGFNGIPYMVKAKHRVEIALWIIVFLVFLLLTIRDICNTVIAYNAAETNTQISVVHTEQFELQPVFCIGLQPTKLAPRSIAFNATNSRQVLDKISGEHPDVFAFLNQSAQLPENGGLSIVEWESDLLSFIGMTAQMLINVVWMENGVSEPGTITAGHQHYGVNRYAESVIYVDGLDAPGDSSATVQMFHDFYMERNVDFPALSKVIGALLCKNLKAKLNCQQSTENATFSNANFSLCEPSKVTWLGVQPFNAQGNFVCLNATTDDPMIWKFKTNQDTCNIFVRYGDWFGEDFKDSLDNAVTYLDFTGGRTMTRSTTNNVNAYAQMGTYYLTLLGSYMGYSTWHRRCQDGQDQVVIPLLDCRGRCRADWMVKNCGCWPISWADIDGKPDSVPYCTITNDTAEQSALAANFTPPHLARPECVEMRMAFDPDPDCWQNCVVPCKENIYSSQLRQTDTGVAIDSEIINGTGFQIKFDNFIYPELTEQLAMGPNELLSNLGGNIGFWVGACMISVVHLLMVLLKVTFGAFSYVREKRALARLRQVESSNCDPSMKPTIMLHNMMNFYKVQTTTELLQKMMSKSGAEAGRGQGWKSSQANKSFDESIKESLKDSKATSRNQSTANFGITHQFLIGKDPEEPADPSVNKASLGGKGNMDDEGMAEFERRLARVEKALFNKDKEQ